jgi:hypothetical protein
VQSAIFSFYGFFNSAVHVSYLYSAEWLGDRLIMNPVPGGYKYGDLALQVGGVLNLRQ